MNTKTSLLGGIAASFTLGLFTPGVAAAQNFGEWGQGALMADLSAPSVADGCPIEAPDGAHFYLASARSGEGTQGMLDIWVAERSSDGDGWENLEPLGAVVNSAYNDFCPTLLPGNWLLFVSDRPVAAPCATAPGALNGDMYITRHDPAHGWHAPEHLGCVPAGTGPNSTGPEFSPSLVETDEGVLLFYSSNGGSGLQDIYVSRLGERGRFEPGVVVPELSTAFDDRMPNVRKDGREVVFSSNRPSWGGGQAPKGGQDVYRATRESTWGTWSDPMNVLEVNTAADETRASMSRDGLRLYFGRSGDIYMSTRHKVHGNE